MNHGQVINLNGLTITARDTPHDAPCLNFSFLNSVGERLLYLTDCGSDEFMRFEEHEVYIIEANYSRKIMEYNVENKKIDLCRYHRAQSGLGHLEIEQTIGILEDSVGDRTQHIILSHLSSANSNGDEFKNRVSSLFPNKEVCIAKYGVNIKYGENPKVF